LEKYFIASMRVISNTQTAQIAGNIISILPLLKSKIKRNRNSIYAIPIITNNKIKLIKNLTFNILILLKKQRIVPSNKYIINTIINVSWRP
jgi:hypothetical protein